MTTVGYYECSECRSTEPRHGNAVQLGTHACRNGAVGTWLWIDDPVRTAHEQLKQLEQVWPVGWKKDDRHSVNTYGALVRGVDVSVQFIAPLPVGFVAGNRIVPITGASLRELVVSLRRVVVNLTEAAVPETAPEVDDRVDLWSKLKPALAAGNWTYNDDNFSALWSSPVGTHCVYIGGEHGKYRVHMEISTLNKLLYASSDIIRAGAPLYDVRKALIDVTYSMMGVQP